MPIFPASFLMVAAAAASTSSLEVDLDGMRNARGVIQACLMRDRKSFPDCRSDPAAVKQTMPASGTRLLFTDLPPGRYALALFHDENVNGKLDTLLGIPREGFGFSRNPVVRFGAPRYDQVSIELVPGFTRLRVRLQYLL
ncbi:MAG TPA: DUF2141 domain-containing protein [Sphingomicrobium sp.]|nr:DUF2141 domain-containing protein [Sphingomicrobium sp.]